MGVRGRCDARALPGASVLRAQSCVPLRTAPGDPRCGRPWRASCYAARTEAPSPSPSTPVLGTRPASPRSRLHGDSHPLPVTSCSPLLDGLLTGRSQGRLAAPGALGFRLWLPGPRPSPGVTSSPAQPPAACPGPSPSPTKCRGASGGRHCRVQVMPRRASASSGHPLPAHRDPQNRGRTGLGSLGCRKQVSPAGFE